LLFGGTGSARQQQAGEGENGDIGNAVHVGILAECALLPTAERDVRPRDRRDAMIAAVATAYRCAVVTRNTRDFPGSEVLDPSQANVENSA
jgi:hypothetical protein